MEKDLAQAEKSEKIPCNRNGISAGLKSKFGHVFGHVFGSTFIFPRLFVRNFIFGAKANISAQAEIHHVIRP